MKEGLVAGQIVPAGQLTLYSQTFIKQLIVQYLLLIIASLFWGSSFVATRYALTAGGLGVFTLLAGRFLIASLILILLLLIRGRQKLKGKDLLRLLAIGVIYPGLYFLFETTGLTRIPAFLASMIIASIPALTGIIAHVFLKERMGLRGWAGTFLSMIGVALIVLLANREAAVPGQQASISIAGVLLTAGAAIMGAVYITSARHLTRSYQPLTLTTAQSLIGLLLFLPMASLELARGQFYFNFWGLVALGFLGIGVSVGAFLSFNKAVSMIEASKASLFLNIIPVISLILGWLLLSESINLGQGFAGLAVIGGVLLATCRPTWRPKKQN